MARRAFSLIEVLVVTAIVAVLVAILLPVLAQAKDSAKKTACVSNSRQLSTAVLLYASDSNDFLPPLQDGEAVLWPHLLGCFSHDAGIRVCPQDHGAANSYGLNSLLFADRYGSRSSRQAEPLNLTQIARSAQTVMLGEVGTEDDLATPRRDAYKLTAPASDLEEAIDARPGVRHAKATVLAFFDGHVASKKLTEFYVRQSPVNRWFCLDPEDEAGCTGQSD